MKKIMFNNKFNLTESVLNGSKTMTRRIISNKELINMLDSIQNSPNFKGSLDALSILHSTYKVGDIVAISQAYKDIKDDKYFINECAANDCDVRMLMIEPGWNNKMFVKAYYMPNKIKITNVRIEHLQDISDDDCIKEGIKPFYWEGGIFYVAPGIHDYYCRKKDAFKHLINAINGNNTWDKNPIVFVYEFELIK